MPAKPRPPMPKLPPFALMEERPPRKAKPLHLLIFFFVFAIPLFFIHLPFLSLPYFWDELGQFVPTAVDFLHGSIVAHSVVPNVHPPGLAAYLAICYKIFGYSTVVTRVAMLLMASCGLLLTFLLAIELCHGAKGAPAFLPPVFLLISPLFFTQSMMAQLDMPAMVFTLVALYLFIKQEYAWAAVACVVSVLMKETGIVTPLVFFCFLAEKRDWKRAAWFATPALALFAWLLILHAKTGYWLGDAEFARYNVNYALKPARMVVALARRVFYLFFAEMRLVGTVALIATVRLTAKFFRTRAWAVVGSVVALNVILVSVLGGAELERYLLPSLPLFYIAVSIALTMLWKPLAASATGLMILAFAFFIRWNPPYPFPFENNYAMVDFLHLQQQALAYVDENLRDRHIATAWPYTGALRRPELGFVEHPIRTVETHDLHYSSVKAIAPERYDTLITYTREWVPAPSVTDSPLVRGFLKRFYAWEPDITPQQCEQMGLHESISWSQHGQTVSIFIRNPATPNGP